MNNRFYNFLLVSKHPIVPLYDTSKRYTLNPNKANI
jgi:hypothetical protein